MMLDTSIDAYMGIKKELGARQRAVFDVIGHLKSATNLEISNFMGLPINQVTPRTNELRKFGKVTDDGKRACTISGKTSYAWRVV